MSIKLSLKDNKVTVTNGTDSVSFEGDDVARFADALANPGKPAFQQDRMVFTTSVATSFGLWQLQDGQLSIFLMGKDEVLDPKVATDFAAELLGPVLVSKATFKLNDEIKSQDHHYDVDDGNRFWSYGTSAKIIGIVPVIDKRTINYVVQTDAGDTYTVSGAPVHMHAALVPPVKTWTTTQQSTVTLTREVEVQARTKEDAIALSKAIRTPGVWNVKDRDVTITMDTMTTAPTIAVATPAGADVDEGWRQDAQGRIRSSDATKFPSDTDATRFVTTRALEGSTRHQTALRKRLGV